MFLKKIVFVAIFLFCFQISLSAADLSSNKNSLILKNQYTFTYYWFKVYTVKLFLDKNQKTSDVLDDINKKLEFTYHRNIEGKLLVEKGDQSLKRNPEFNFEKYRRELNLINSKYSNVGENDKFILDYDTEKGLTLLEKRANDSYPKKLVTIKNKDFAKYYFGIWLSKYALGKGVYSALVND